MRDRVIASDLDRLVTLELAGAPTRGASGSAKPSAPTTITNVPAAFRPLTGAEIIRAGQVATTYDARFRLRFRTDVKPKDKVLFDGVEYDVQFVREIGRQQGIEILAKARGV